MRAGMLMAIGVADNRNGLPFASEYVPSTRAGPLVR